jgi:hypothetical protein
VGIEPAGPFTDLGAPVTGDEGALVAIGAMKQSSEGGIAAQFIDVDAIRAILEAEAND